MEATEMQKYDRGEEMKAFDALPPAIRAYIAENGFSARVVYVEWRASGKNDAAIMAEMQRQVRTGEW